MYTASLLKVSGVSPVVRVINARRLEDIVSRLAQEECRGVMPGFCSDFMWEVSAMARAVAERWIVKNGESVCVNLNEPETLSMIEDAIRAVLEERLCELNADVYR